MESTDSDHDTSEHTLDRYMIFVYSVTIADID